MKFVIAASGTQSSHKGGIPGSDLGQDSQADAEPSGRYGQAAQHSVQGSRKAQGTH